MAGQIYHNSDSKRAQNSNNRQKRTKVRYPPRHEELGHIVSDTIERITDGIKDCFYSDIDAIANFAFILNYKRQNTKICRRV